MGIFLNFAAVREAFMATYVISDIHGMYDKFIGLLDKIGFGDDDTLYILGDVLDRGPDPIKTLYKIYEMPNAVFMIGNHELMAYDCLKLMMKEITDEALDGIDPEMYGQLSNWLIYNGGETTLKEFRALDTDSRQDVIEMIGDGDIYEELTVNGQKYLLVHAGLGNFEPDKDMEDYSLKELLWDRADYDTRYFEDVCVVTGHTPTQLIEDCPNPGYIFKKNNHIAIDCGAYHPTGRLAAICLDTQEEFYY